ncbi:MAG: MarC family protein [Verrucomicrobiae bacterium]
MLGQTGINVLTRLAGILVAAIALQMILTGLLDTFPGLEVAALHRGEPSQVPSENRDI